MLLCRSISHPQKEEDKMKTFLVDYVIYTDGPKGTTEQRTTRQVKANTTQEAAEWLTNYWQAKGKRIQIYSFHDADLYL